MRGWMRLSGASSGRADRHVLGVDGALRLGRGVPLRHRGRLSHPRAARGPPGDRRPGPSPPALPGPPRPAGRTRTARGRRRGRRRPRPRRRRTWPPPHPGDDLRRGRGHPYGLPGQDRKQPAPHRRGVEPALRTALPRPAPALRHRGVQRQLRRGDLGAWSPDRRRARQTPGGAADRPRRGRLRSLLRRPAAARRHPRQGGRHLRRRQGRGHAPRGTAAPDRRCRREVQDQTEGPSLEGRKGQPEADGRGGRGLHRRPQWCAAPRM